VCGTPLAKSSANFCVKCAGSKTICAVFLPRSEHLQSTPLFRTENILMQRFWAPSSAPCIACSVRVVSPPLNAKLRTAQLVADATVSSSNTVRRLSYHSLPVRYRLVATVTSPHEMNLRCRKPRCKWDLVVVRVFFSVPSALMKLPRRSTLSVSTTDGRAS